MASSTAPPISWLIIIIACLPLYSVGARGIPRPFNGIPDQSFCLITERHFQVNIGLKEYDDRNAVGAHIINNGKAATTWVKELGIVWLEKKNGRSYTLKMVARDGNCQKRGTGFLSSILVDDATAPKMLPGDQILGDGGLKVKFIGHKQEGRELFDVDLYRIKLPGALHFEVRARLAHPLHQTKDDAMAHINVNFLEVQSTQKTHGVLGQTFQPGRHKRPLDNTVMSFLLRRNVAADSSLGMGFLDGSGEDYKTSGMLATDCKFSSFD